MIARQTVSSALATAARTPRGVTAIEHDGRAVTIPYATLLAESLAIAGGLSEEGLEPADRVAIIVPEIGDFIAVFFAVTGAGLVAVPLVPPAQAGDLPTFFAFFLEVFFLGVATTNSFMAQTGLLGLIIGGALPRCFRK